MATAETVELSEPHAPKEASIHSFESILTSLKHELVKLRHNHDKHEPEYFRAVSSLSDSDLTSFTPADVETVRVGTSAYGLHLFGKVRIPAAENAYIHVRVFIAAEDGTDGSSEEERVAKLHCIHTEEVVKDDGDHVYRAIFGKNDELEWFDT
ncbi:uncharacterized protein BDR25DRAFT_333807 [Lindgomyces ingoldianus]|uniref:Uncharacterized protein n=1 Tax=Lindgomyces ingoldianus TaxID=673940 RepID=A0ACB6QXM4_9PLEO|nr:uncharacterized protein BDR25DRAFT_333807 [Lindgomyces ingoldianus]KAF2471789.1 hypothetical protein BDR25DRAFT_333807 [Lindgomyces ingoldianus]